MKRNKKSRSVILTTEEVRAILEGRKSQHRIVMKNQPVWNEQEVPGVGAKFWDFGWCYYWPESGYVHTWDDDGIGGPNWTGSQYPNEDALAEALKVSPSTKKCPFGDVGDVLWVKESFLNNRYITMDIDGENHEKWGYKIEYVADGAIPRELHPGFVNNPVMKRRPSVHMRECESRITLVIAAIRVERLQNISEEDAQREGVNPFASIAREQTIAGDQKGRAQGSHPHTLSFASRWDGKSSDKNMWIENPWVWVIEFKSIIMERK